MKNDRSLIASNAPPESGESRASLPLVSIVIPAHNEANYIGATLDALRQQTYRFIETLVICNGCTDNTAEIARQKADRVVILEERGLSRARNFGAEKARGSILVFLDADTWIGPGAIGQIVREFDSTCAAATLRGEPDSGRWSHRLIYVLKNLLHASALHKGSSGVIICWRDAFKRVKGFDPDLHVRENSDLIQKLLHSGRYRFIRSVTATTSMRRYEKCGTLRTSLHWCKIWLRSVLSDIRHFKYDSVR